MEKEEKEFKKKEEIEKEIAEDISEIEEKVEEDKITQKEADMEINEEVEEKIEEIEEKFEEEKKEDKEIEKKSDKKENKKDLKKKQDKQLKWAVFLMISVLLIIILVPIIKVNFFDKFVYIKLDFQKTKLGDIDFYSTRVPVASMANGKLGVTGEYLVNLRNDPRELDKIEFTKNITDVDYVYFKEDQIVYISLNPEMKSCEDVSIALIPFAGFLRDFAKQEVDSAYSDEEYANLINVSYVTCSNSPDNTVIYINSGDKNEIKKTARNCYEMTYKDCDIVKVTERFMLLVLEKYMSYLHKV